MAYGGVCGILDYTAGGHVFGISGTRTESGHQEWEGSIGPLYDSVLACSVTFSKTFKNIPEVTIENETGEFRYTDYVGHELDIRNDGFDFYAIASEALGGRMNSGSGSFDWTATGK